MAAPPDLLGTEVRRSIARHLDNQAVQHRQELAALEWQHPGAPARAMALEDLPMPHNSRLLIRGNPGNPGPEIPRRLLKVLADQTHRRSPTAADASKSPKPSPAGTTR